MFSKVGLVLLLSAITTNDQIQLLSALGALAMANMVSAHGHVMSWVVDGTAHAGFNPSNPTLYGATAERPTLNKDQGEFVARLWKPKSDNQVSPTSLLALLLVVGPILALAFKP